MAKKEILIPIEKAIEQQIIANSVSKDVIEREFGDLKRRLEAQEKKIEKQEGKLWGIMIGSVIAVFIFLAVQLWSTWTFMADYNKHLLDTRGELNSKTDDIIKGNIDLKTTIKGDIDRMKDKQDYFEKLLLDRASVK